MLVFSGGEGGGGGLQINFVFIGDSDKNLSGNFTTQSVIIDRSITLKSLILIL